MFCVIFIVYLFICKISVDLVHFSFFRSEFLFFVFLCFVLVCSGESRFSQPVLSLILTRI